jgi:hypothetical protein
MKIPFSADGFGLGLVHEPPDVTARAIEYLRSNYARNVVERAELETFIGRAIIRRLQIEQRAPSTVRGPGTDEMNF